MHVIDFGTLYRTSKEAPIALPRRPHKSPAHTVKDHQKPASTPNPRPDRQTKFSAGEPLIMAPFSELSSGFWKNF